MLKSENDTFLKYIEVQKELNNNSKNQYERINKMQVEQIKKIEGDIIEKNLLVEEKKINISRSFEKLFKTDQLRVAYLP